jgi:hypothetical protein
VRTALVLSAIVACNALALCSDRPGQTTVSGTVVLAEDSSRVAGARVLFQGSDGRNFKATTNQVGEYEVVLDAMKEYTLSVGGQQLCQLHRPAFLAKPGSALRFNFSSSICGIIDGVLIVPPGVAHNDNRPYYRAYCPSDDKNYPYWSFEEGIPLRNENDGWIVIAFGSRVDEGKVRYGPFRMRQHVPGTPLFLPVTISFDTYTIRADTAVLDRRGGVLKAEGHVEDGTASSAKSQSCVSIALSAEQPRPEMCSKSQ